MLTQEERDYGFDENDIEELMDSFEEAMTNLNNTKG